MKYNININQKVICEVAKELDLIDAAILDYLICFCSADNKKIKQLNYEENGQNFRYTWINIKKLLEEMPLLKLKSKSAVSRRINKIKDSGFIKTFSSPDNSLFVRLTEKTSILFFNNIRMPF